MTTEAPPRLLTAEEFYALPDPVDGGKMELVCGRVVTHMPVGDEHSYLASEISAELRQFVKANRLGRVGVEAGFVLHENPTTVRAPDVHFMAESQSGGRTRGRAFINGAPDLAVEVVSPDDSSTEVGRKVGQYLDAVSARVWVVDPELQSISVHRQGFVAHTLHVGDALTSDDAGFAVDGFSLELKDLFS